jgi:protoporphyrinogen oxidase
MSRSRLEFSSNMKQVAILGGGIAGLSAAHVLAKSGRVKVHLIERSDRCGGWIKTLRNKSLFEAGYYLFISYAFVSPRTLRPVGDSGTATLDLVKF